jgi:hypothetical protein
MSRFSGELWYLPAQPPMGTNIHTHFQTMDNKVSGHVQGLKLGKGMTLNLPKG